MKRIEEIFAFVARTDGGEDVIGDAICGEMIIPLLSDDMSKVERLRPIARDIGIHMNAKVYLLRFSNREDLGEV